MGGFTAALTAASMGMQVLGQYQAGKAGEQAAKYNAAAYDQQAQNIAVKKDISALQYDRAIEQLRGTGITTIASQGRDLSGSALLVLSDSIEQMEFDKSIEQYNLSIDENRALTSAEEYRLQAGREKRAGIVNAATTLLTQGNDWYEKYGGFGKPTNLGAGTTSYGVSVKNRYTLAK